MCTQPPRRIAARSALPGHTFGAALTSRTSQTRALMQKLSAGGTACTPWDWFGCCRWLVLPANEGSRRGVLRIAVWQSGSLCSPTTSPPRTAHQLILAPAMRQLPTTLFSHSPTSLPQWNCTTPRISKPLHFIPRFDPDRPHCQSSIIAISF